jgi:two-component sensor histidine kinase
MVAPDSQAIACPLSGRNSTYRPVQNSATGSIQAMARQTARTSATFAEFETQFGSRVQGLAQSNSLLIDQDWKGVSLDKLIETQLAPFVGIDTMRIEAVGPPVRLAPGAVQTLGLALHELATNASKYGSAVSCRRSGGAELELRGRKRRSRVLPDGMA